MILTMILQVKQPPIAALHDYLLWYSRFIKGNSIPYNLLKRHHRNKYCFRTTNTKGAILHVLIIQHQSEPLINSHLTTKPFG